MGANQGRRNKLAVSILNYLDTALNKLTEGLTYALGGVFSANFGTPRDSRRGGCYKGDGSSKVDVSAGMPPDLYSLDSFEVSLYLEKKLEVSRTVWGYRDGSTEFLQISIQNTPQIIVYHYDGTYNGSLTHAFVESPGEYMHVKVRLENIQTATPTIYLIVDDEIVNNTTYTKGANLRSIKTTLLAVYGGSFYALIAQQTSIFGVVVKQNDVVTHSYECDESTGAICLDSGGKDYHGTIIDAITVPGPTSIHQSQNVNSRHNIAGFTVSDGVSYYSDAAATSLIPEGVLIPRLENNPLPPFKCAAYTAPGVRADLQYIGHAQNNSDFVGSACFKGNGVARMGYLNFPHTPIGTLVIECTVLLNAGDAGQLFSVDQGTNRLWQLTTGGTGWGFIWILGGVVSNTTLTPIHDGKPHHLRVEIDISDGAIRTYTDGVLDVSGNNAASTAITDFYMSFVTRSASFVETLDGGSVFNCKLSDDNGLFAYWPLSEPITDAANHTYFDKVSGNNATLINGTSANQGSQDEYHDLQVNGYGALFNFINTDSFIRVDPPPEIPNDPDPVITVDIEMSLALDNLTVTQYPFTFQVGGTGTGELIIRFDRFFLPTSGQVYIDGVLSTYYPNDNDFHTLEVRGLLVNASTFQSLRQFTVGRGSASIVGTVAYFLIKQGGTEIFRMNRLSNNIINVNNVEDGQLVPASITNPTKDAIGNDLIVYQDGKSLLKCGGTTKLKMNNSPRIQQSKSAANENKIVYSEQLDNAAYSFTGSCIVTADNTIAPDGQVTADLLEFTANSKLRQFVTIGTGNITFSVFVKGTKGQTINIGITGLVNSLETLTGEWDRFEVTGNELTGGSKEFYIGTATPATALTLWAWGMQVNSGIVAYQYYRTEGVAKALEYSSFWADQDGNMLSLGVDDFKGVEVGNAVFAEIVSSEQVRNIRTYDEGLSYRQLETEKVITKNN